VRRRLSAAFAAAALLAVHARPVAGQFEEPCELACIGVLATTSFVTATGAAVGMGRLTGGMSSVNQGVVVWGGTFAAMAGGGMALSGDGRRQERAVYGAGIGLAAGAVTGLLIEAIRTRGDEPRVLAGSLMGAALGAVVGGVVGVITYDGDGASSPVPVLSVTIPF